MTGFSGFGGGAGALALPHPNYSLEFEAYIEDLISQVGRRKWAQNALRWGVRIPFRYYLWLGLGYEIALLIYNNRNQIMEWIQGPFENRAFCSGSLTNPQSFGMYPLGYTSCPVPLQAVPGATPFPTANITSTSLMQLSNVANRYIAEASWRRISGTTVLVPQYQMSDMPFPIMSPWHMPLETPIFRPITVAPTALWLPSRAAQIEKDNYVKAISGVPIAPVQVLDRDIASTDSPRPPFIDLGSPIPASTQFGGDGFAHLIPAYKSAVVPYGTKERKIVIRPGDSAGGQAITGVMNITTETRDVARALFFAIPRKYRPQWPNGKTKKLNTKQMLQFIYDNYEHMDMEKAMNNMLDNQRGDALGGISNRGRKFLYKKLYKKYGNAGSLAGQAVMSKAFKPPMF